ncbi:hypothetical protein ABLA76_17670 [Xenorhabdus sp. SGI240]
MGQELTLLKWVSLSAENIGMQKGDYLCRRKSSLQNPMSENRTLPSSSGIAQDLCVNIIYSQNLYTSLRVAQTFRVSFSDAVNLRLTVSQVQKEKV